MHDGSPRPILMSPADDRYLNRDKSISPPNPGGRSRLEGTRHYSPPRDDEEEENQVVGNRLHFPTSGSDSCVPASEGEPSLITELRLGRREHRPELVTVVSSAEAKRQSYSSDNPPSGSNGLRPSSQREARTPTGECANLQEQRRKMAKEFFMPWKKSERDDEQQSKGVRDSSAPPATGGSAQVTHPNPWKPSYQVPRDVYGKYDPSKTRDHSLSPGPKNRNRSPVRDQDISEVEGQENSTTTVLPMSPQVAAPAAKTPPPQNNSSSSSGRSTRQQQPTTGLVTSSQYLPLSQNGEDQRGQRKDDNEETFTTIYPSPLGQRTLRGEAVGQVYEKPRPVTPEQRAQSPNAQYLGTSKVVGLVPGDRYTDPNSPEQTDVLFRSKKEEGNGGASPSRRGQEIILMTATTTTDEEVGNLPRRTTKTRRTVVDAATSPIMLQRLEARGTSNSNGNPSTSGRVTGNPAPSRTATLQLPMSPKSFLSPDRKVAAEKAPPPSARPKGNLHTNNSTNDVSISSSAAGTLGGAVDLLHQQRATLAEEITQLQGDLTYSQRRQQAYEGHAVQLRDQWNTKLRAMDETSRKLHQRLRELQRDE